MKEGILIIVTSSSLPHNMMTSKKWMLVLTYVPGEKHSSAHNHITICFKPLTKKNENISLTKRKR